ncbi:hypothetical protein HAD_05405 [Hyphomonas adhaerens MHS-3]|uniref:Peptidase C14 caspase domain-containing protein n=1 Tax=Hyphomonas adhaerens MHS-3 TaxID=1280949 RepID=A0A069E4W0_9PROT|nr:caspase family protein [Hyphomonas adhaerens]KCZ85092.1 hypothetical protein HAD_05405 [Hyphomonas adhaerens MHS-3]
MISRRHLLLLGGAAALPWPGRADESGNGSGRGPRHALIIGNAAYSEGIGTLANPVRDAHRVAEGIVECGFSLVTGDVVKDAGRSEMMSAFRAYVDAMQASGPDATGFVYYSGHGAARDGEGNFLIPVEDAAVLDEALWDDSVSLDWVMGKLTDSEAPTVLSIDACRNVLKLPEAERALGGGESFRGLRRSAGSAEERNMFISFATWEGETASDGLADDGNGPYAKALGTRLLEPAVTVRDMFENVRLDVLEMTRQRQEPMNLSRLQRRSSDIKIGSWSRAPGAPSAPVSQNPLRVALVFSNDYSESDPYGLPNTHADGEKVASALGESGYKVRHIRNADLAGFNDGLAMLRNALNAAGPASVGVVYFAGYGASLYGEDNYLIPNGPLPRNDYEVGESGAKLQDAVEFLEDSAAQAVIVMVDCGRKYDSPMETKGLEPGFADYTSDANVVIAYADKPGTTRPDTYGPSVFADAFARRVRSPDRIDINKVMLQVSGDVIAETANQQQPWFQSSVRLPIFFRADVEDS